MTGKSTEAQLLQTELNVEVNEPDNDKVLEMNLLTALSATVQCCPEKGKALLDSLTDEILCDFFAQYSKIRLLF